MRGNSEDHPPPATFRLAFRHAQYTSKSTSCCLDVEKLELNLEIIRSGESLVVVEVSAMLAGGGDPSPCLTGKWHCQGHFYQDPDLEVPFP